MGTGFNAEAGRVSERLEGAFKGSPERFFEGDGCCSGRYCVLFSDRCCVLLLFVDGVKVPALRGWLAGACLITGSLPGRGVGWAASTMPEKRARTRNMKRIIDGRFRKFRMGIIQGEQS